jgi:hypothetical protein
MDPAVGVMAEQPPQKADEHVLVELAVIQLPLQVPVVGDDRDHVGAKALAGHLLDRGDVPVGCRSARAHTFWNEGDEPARILEIISPAGFERFFAELVGLGGVANAAPEALADLCARYELDMNPDSVPELVERFGVKFPGEPI